MATATGGLVFERTTLPNGVRLLTAPMPHVQSTSCFVMLAAGSRYETAETNGIAHFAEHMFFKGTERRPTARDIAGEIDSIGGEFNAFTGKEYTGYYVKCAAEHAPTAFDVLTDMIGHSRFDPDEIEREKGVIIEEMNMYFDTPRDFMSGLYESLLYGDQPLGWDIIGRKETVRAATRETFLDYIDRWYKPTRLVVGVGGRFDGELLARVEELVSEFAPGEQAGPDPVVLPSYDEPRVIVAQRSSPTRRTSRSACRATRSRIPTATCCSCSRRCSAAACRRACSPRCASGAGSRTTSSASTTATPTRLALLAGRRRHQPDRRGRRRRSCELRGSRRAGAADELEKARNFAKGRFVLQLESPHGTIMFGLRREVLEGRATEPSEVLEALDTVTAEDIQRVAQDVIAGNALNLAVIGPFDDEERFRALIR
jgi:predicted Zn-dependent peptidase